MRNVTKTQIKVGLSTAHQGLSDMTVLLEHIEKGDLQTIKNYAEFWLAEYKQRYESYKKYDANF